ncbi:extracellular solute-binding protein [Kribbella sp. NBC_01245]|uniref:ABC transporter substrate-binding protein n=1 Tax=Kribbella sp. NBC_01245 TaxID=2903578 RepID=UPI002E2C5AB0|nr:extracellular solute-binding protein [Kribbella sp. NBC_01245]
MAPRWTGAVAAATVMTVALAGCTSGGKASSTASSGGVELTMLTFETPNLPATLWDSTIARVSAKFPGLTIKKLVTPNVDRTTYAKQLASSGQLPDVMLAVNPQGFAEGGQLAEFTADELKDFASPTSGAINGKVYQLPTNAQPQSLLYYNKGAFAKAGVTQPPKTWAEFLAACAKLKSAGVTPIAVGGGGQDTFASMYPWVGVLGTDVYRADPKFNQAITDGGKTFTDAAFVKATGKIAQLAQLGYLDKQGTSRSYADHEKAFRAGSAAMYPMGSWFATSADNDKPKFDVGVFAWPTDDGQAVVPTLTGGGLSVSAKAEDVGLAKRFALEWTKDKATADAFTKADGTFNTVAGYQPPADMGPLFKATLALYEQAVKDDTVTPAFSIEQGDNGLPAAMTKPIEQLAVELLNGTSDAAAVAAKLDKEYADLK